MAALSVGVPRVVGMLVRWRFALESVEIVPELLELDGASVDILKWYNFFEILVMMSIQTMLDFKAK